MEPVGHQNPHLPPLPDPPQTVQWWLITPSPMEFENVGFTRPVQPLTELGASLRLPLCFFVLTFIAKDARSNSLPVPNVIWGPWVGQRKEDLNSGYLALASPIEHDIILKLGGGRKLYNCPLCIPIISIGNVYFYSATC